MKSTLKRILSILIALVAVFCLTVNMFADGTLNCWMSDSSSIGRWTQSSISIYLYKLNSNSSFYFSESLSNATTQWKSSTGLAFLTGTSSSYDIIYYGGTMSELAERGYSFESNLAGQTTYSYYPSKNETWTYGNTTKTICTVFEATGLIVDKGKTLAQQQETETHELGHALGWFGHSGVSNDLMYSLSHSPAVTAPTGRDKAHLYQVYY